eukprot:3122846-Pyramimonas_sp.AAC.1
MDNGNWGASDGNMDIIHWCPYDCTRGRSRGSALVKMRAAIKMSVGPSCPLALECRWGHMEKANA